MGNLESTDWLSLSFWAVLKGPVSLSAQRSQLQTISIHNRVVVVVVVVVVVAVVAYNR